jgi:hypothetical protein
VVGPLSQLEGLGEEHSKAIAGALLQVRETVLDQGFFCVTQL